MFWSAAKRIVVPVVLTSMHLYIMSSPCSLSLHFNASLLISKHSLSLDACKTLRLNYSVLVYDVDCGVEF